MRCPDLRRGKVEGLYPARQTKSGGVPALPRPVRHEQQGRCPRRAKFPNRRAEQIDWRAQHAHLRRIPFRRELGVGLLTEETRMLAERAEGKRIDGGLHSSLYGKPYLPSDPQVAAGEASRKAIGEFVGSGGNPFGTDM